MQLSEHFSKEKFENSMYARRHKIDNSMSTSQEAAATRLCTQILEKVREHYGKPIIISSGYRSVPVNTGIGGSPTSQHTKGEAADIKIHGVTPYELTEWIAKDSGLPFDQCIYEFEDWTHVSFTNRHKPRQELLTINHEGTFTGLRG